MEVWISPCGGEKNAQMSRAHPSAVRNTAQVSCTVILWVCFFDFAMTAQPTRFGIEVFDGSGKVTFSSNMIPLDVIDVIEHENVTDLRDSNGVYFRRKYASGVVPAVLPLRTPFWAIQGSHNYLADLATIGYCVQGSELIAKRGIALAQGWFPIPVEFYRGYKAIVIDVKRYSNIA